MAALITARDGTDDHDNVVTVLVDRAQRRKHWIAAGSAVTKALMADTETSPWLISARAARRAAGTAGAAVWLPAASAGHTGLRLGASDGETPEPATAVLMADRAFRRRVVKARSPVFVEQSSTSAAILVVPLLAADQILGLLTLPAGKRDHLRSPAEQRMLSAFCRQTALACQLAQAQNDQRKVAIYADRDRIARDLHDQVIQQLFGAGLLLQGLEQFIPSAPAKRVRDVIERLDRTIVDIRRSIFSLHIAQEDRQGVRQAVMRIALEAAASLGFTPQVQLDELVDQAVPADAADDILAVVREGLSNVARHAQASRVSLELTIAGQALTIEITDNGRGVPAGQSRRSGLLNLVDRANCRGGHCELTATADRAGSQLTWHIPL